MGVLLYTMMYKENPFYNVDEIVACKLRIPFIISAGIVKKRELYRCECNGKVYFE
jgi:hypothetical protein